MDWRNTKYLRDTIKKECINNKWNNNMSENIFSNNFSSTLLSTNNIEKNKDNTVWEIIDKLYPNHDMPSDHPMVGTIMFLD